MTTPTHTFGNPAKEADGTETPKLNAGAVRKPWKPSEDMLDEAENAYGDVSDMDTTRKMYCEAVLIACRPLIIAEYEESKK